MRHKELLDRYCAYVGLTRTASTVSAHRAKLAPLFKAWEHLEVKDFSRPLFETYVAEGNKTWKPRTLQMLLDYARAFIRWCAENEIPCPDFVGKMKKPRVHAGKVIFYSEEEIATLLEATKGTRLSVVVAAGAYLGCRKTEVWNLMWEDVNWEDRLVTIHGTKTGKDREVPMSDTCYRVLRAFWRNQKRGRLMEGYDWFKINAYRDLKRVAERAEVEFKGLHALRRSFATHLLGKGAASPDVLELGGWTSLKTLSRYGGTTSARKRAAVALLG